MGAHSPSSSSTPGRKAGRCILESTQGFPGSQWKGPAFQLLPIPLPRLGSGQRGQDQAEQQLGHARDVLGRHEPAHRARFRGQRLVISHSPWYNPKLKPQKMTFLGRLCTGKTAVYRGITTSKTTPQSNIVRCLKHQHHEDKITKEFTLEKTEIIAPPKQNL